MNLVKIEKDSTSNQKLFYKVLKYARKEKKYIVNQVKTKKVKILQVMMK